MRLHPNKKKEYQDALDNSRKRKSTNEACEPSAKKATITGNQGQTRQTKITDMTNKSKQNDYEQKVVSLFVENMLPFHVIESDSFASFAGLISGVKMISRRTLTRQIETRYKTEVHNLKTTLQNVSFVATTADCWSCRNRSYIGMTIHWIDPESLSRKSSVLACDWLQGVQSYDVIAKKMCHVHWNFAIESKVTKTTTDNGSNFVKAFRIFASLQDLTDDNEEVDADPVHMTDVTSVLGIVDDLQNYALPKHHRCAAHSLNLVASSDASEALKRSCSYKRVYYSVFGKATALWNKQSRSSQAADIIENTLGQKLLVPCITRWNSLHDCVGRLLSMFECREKLDDLNSICDKFKIAPFTYGDIMFFKQYYQAMQPICVALDILQGEKNAYMGVLLPTIAMCLKRLFFVQGNDSLRLSKPLLDAVTAVVKQRFLAKFEDLDLLLASAFHPQFKLHWIKWLCDVGIVEQIENLQKRIKVKMISLVDSELKQSESDDSSDGGAESRCSNMESFFEPLCRKSENTRTGYNIVQRFLDENTSSAVTAEAFFLLN